MKDPTVKDPKHVTIKVTDNEHRCFFVHFDRISHELVNVDEYRVVYRPWMSNMPSRIKAAVDAARTKIPETIGETS